MPLPRRVLVDLTESGYYHCISRCVRRAFLCGGEFEHRREWAEARARELASVFAIDVCHFGILRNHYHLILRNEPDAADEWSTEEVRRRWKLLFPKSAGAGSRGSDGGDVRIGVLRKRLCDLSWFMRCLNEYIAIRANREDGCTGRFWEGRFKSQRLLDEAAVLACSIYIDLNLIRAGLAPTPEQSDFTSVQNRIHVKQLHEKRRRERARAPQGAEQLIAHEAEFDAQDSSSAGSFRADESGIWLVPVELAHPGTPKPRSAAARRRRGMFAMTLNAYLELVDAFGRIVRAGKGCIAGSQRSILDRLRIDADRLTTLLQGGKRLYGTVAGAAELVRKEARRRGRTRAVKIFDTSRGN